MYQGKMPTLITPTRNDVVVAARRWLGVSFRHQGRSANGVDCVGLVIEVARELGFVAPDFDYRNYPRRTPHSEQFIAPFREHLLPIRWQDRKPGDVAILKEPAFPCHCGILAEKNGAETLIHAHLPRKVVLEDYFVSGGFDKKLMAVFSFPGFAN